MLRNREEEAGEDLEGAGEDLEGEGVRRVLGMYETSSIDLFSTGGGFRGGRGGGGFRGRGGGKYM